MGDTEVTGVYGEVKSPRINRPGEEKFVTAGEISGVSEWGKPKIGGRKGEGNVTLGAVGEAQSWVGLWFLGCRMQTEEEK